MASDLLQQILTVIGAASLSGCATRTVDDGEEGAEGESDGIMLPDVGEPTDTDPTGGDQCGEVMSVGPLSFEPPPECNYEPALWGSNFYCFTPPAGTTCADEPYSTQCILDEYQCGIIESGNHIACGPYTTPEGMCCYVVTGECALGRPFCVAGRARVAALASGSQWAAAPQPELTRLGHATRAALADTWRRHGQSEHASVASFARFTTQLLALGAPARLIAAALQAGADERRHALRCFGLANAYAGAASRPGALDVRACLQTMDPVAIARSLASEACVAETVSLMLLCAARDRAEDRAVRVVLSEMIDDERRHVLLAWDALAWLCRRFGGHVQAAVAQVFAEAELHVGFGAVTMLCGDPTSMRAHGYLPIDERRTVAVTALRELVLPAARAVAVARYGTMSPRASR